jgi:hypothetical protein
VEYSLKQSHVSAFRLARHYLSERREADPTLVCKEVCGVQAQIMGSARLALWARIRDVTQKDIHAALYTKHTLVRTSCMRQTLHLIPAVDFSIYVSALRKSRIDALMRVMSRFDIGRKEFDGLNRATVDALAGGALTLQELTARVLPLVGKKVRDWMGRVWGGIAFRPAVVEGLICYGPDRGNQVTFVRVDQWLPKQRAIAEGDAQQVLFRRYLKAYGPATLQDFARWTGISMPEAREIGRLAAEDLVDVSIEGKNGLILSEDCEKLTGSGLSDQVLRLLPAFDPYMLGHVEKSHLLDSAYYKRVYRNQGWISPVVLLDGKTIGTWSHTIRGKELLVELVPFAKFSRAVRDRIEEEATRLGEFFGAASTEIKFRQE